MQGQRALHRFFMLSFASSIRQRSTRVEVSGSGIDGHRNMKTFICKVVAQTEPVYVPSKKAAIKREQSQAGLNSDEREQARPQVKFDNGQLAKSMIRLKELGGEYEDEYICAMFGNLALSKFAAGKTVIASLRFQTHESNGSYFQDVVANDIQNI